MRIWLTSRQDLEQSFVLKPPVSRNGGSGRRLIRLELKLASCRRRQIKAVAVSRGTRAKTDRIDAKLNALFLTFRPDAGRKLPTQNLRLLRTLTIKRGQLVETRKRLLAQIKARQNQGLDDTLQNMDVALHLILDTQIGALETQIELLITADNELAQATKILRSGPGISSVTSSILIAEMPELGQISGEQATVLTGLAPIAHDSGAMRGKRAIGAGPVAVARDVPDSSRSELSQSCPQSLR